MVDETRLKALLVELMHEISRSVTPASARVVFLSNVKNMIRAAKLIR